MCLKKYKETGRGFCKLNNNNHYPWTTIINILKDDDDDEEFILCNAGVFLLLLSPLTWNSGIAWREVYNKRKTIWNFSNPSTVVIVYLRSETSCTLYSNPSVHHHHLLSHQSIRRRIFQQQKPTLWNFLSLVFSRIFAATLDFLSV